MSANERQVGGGHYNKEGEQHWDRIYRLYGRGYFVGCATKYIERYHLKNGKQDLEKAIHFIQKLMELEYPLEAESPHPVERPTMKRLRKAVATLEEAHEGEATRAYVAQD